MSSILQYGEGNFIRSFIDYLIQLNKNNFGGTDTVTVVTPIDNPGWEIFRKAGMKYHTCVCGKVDGKCVNDYTLVDIIDDVVNPYREEEKYINAYMDPNLKAIISNTTEAGIAFDANDKFEGNVSGTFPAKITKILYARYKAYGEEGKVIMLPLELIDHNADTLKAYVLKYAEIWGLEDGFKKFVDTTIFYNTLVDKIVPGFPRGNTEKHFKAMGCEDNIMTVGEAFLSWVVQGDSKIADVLPFMKDPRVKFVTDLKPYRERKVKILNGMHTALAPIALLSDIQIVRDAINDKVLRKYAIDLSEKEIMPTIKMDEKLLYEFRDAILERFANPYIDHYFSSIILNSVSKWKTRLLPSFLDCKPSERKHMLVALASLFCLYDSKDFTIKDSADVIEFFAKDMPTEEKFHAFLSNKAWWDMDLAKESDMLPTAYEYVKQIKAGKITDLVKSL